MKKVLAVLVMVCMLVTIAACAAAPAVPAAPAEQPQQDSEQQAQEQEQPVEPEQVFVLKLSTTQAEGSVVVDGFNDFSEKLEAATNGGILCEVYPGGQLGGEEDLIDQALLGANICVRTDSARISNYVHDIGILGMGYFVDNYEEALAATASTTFQNLLGQATDAGLHILSFNYTQGSRDFYTNKEIKTPDDLKGLIIRTPSGDPYVKTISAMGATPYNLARGEVYNSIQTGAIDGCELGYSSANDEFMFEVCKYCTLTQHIYLSQCLVVGEKWFQTLPEEYQKALVEVAQAVGETNSADMEAELARARDKMIESGLIINEVDLAPFKTAADKAYEELGWTELRHTIYDEIGKAY